jgi:DNA-binding CsgD family transcriptional regulator
MKSAIEQIMDRLCAGYSMSEIARAMDINRRTLEARIYNLRMLK